MEKKKRTKTGGRKAGTPNKTTTEIKQLLTDFVGINIDTLQSDYNKLKPGDRLRFLKDILKFVIPAQASTEVTLNSLTDSQLDGLYEEVLKKISN